MHHFKHENCYKVITIILLINIINQYNHKILGNFFTTLNTKHKIIIKE